MANNNLKKPFKALPAFLNHGIVELVEVDLARQGRNGHARTFAFKNVAEVLKVRIAAAHTAVAEFEGRDIGRKDDFIGGIAGVGRQAMSLRIADLEG